MKTMIVIRNIPGFHKLNKPEALFPAEEVDQLETGMLAGLSQEELLALKQKLSDTFDWLESGDWGIGDPH